MPDLKWLQATSAALLLTTMALCSPAAQAQTFPTTTPLPASVVNGACTTPTELAIPVSGVTAPLAAISVNIGLTAAWAGDVTAELIAPGGAASMFLFGRIGKVTSASFGANSNFGGVYTFVDPAISANNIWTAASAIPSTDTIPPGSYATTQVGDAGVSNPAPTVPFLAVFSGLTPAQINGNWTLRVADCGGGDQTTVQSASLTLAQTPAAAAVTPVPTLGEWALMGLMLTMLGVGAHAQRRRAKA